MLNQTMNKPHSFKPNHQRVIFRAGCLLAGCLFIFAAAGRAAGTAALNPDQRQPGSTYHRGLRLPPEAAAGKYIVAVKHRRRMFLYENRQQVAAYEIALSQSPQGHKQRKGDNRLPEGRYRICQKAKGPFPGRWGRYFGPRWLRINYPNADDARAGLKRGLISRAQHDAIVAADRNNRIPPQDTVLGGGIGIHGWAPSDWPDEGNRHLTWGCISMHNRELIGFYNWAELGTPVFIVR